MGSGWTCQNASKSRNGSKPILKKESKKLNDLVTNVDVQAPKNAEKYWVMCLVIVAIPLFTNCCEQVVCRNWKPQVTQESHRCTRKIEQPIILPQQILCKSLHRFELKLTVKRSTENWRCTLQNSRKRLNTRTDSYVEHNDGEGTQAYKCSNCTIEICPNWVTRAMDDQNDSDLSLKWIPRIISFNGLTTKTIQNIPTTNRASLGIISDDEISYNEDSSETSCSISNNEWDLSSDEDSDEILPIKSGRIRTINNIC